MSISNVFFTNKGKILQAQAQTGTPLLFTRIAIGDGELQGQAPQTFNSLVNEKLSIDITKLIAGEDGTAKIGGSFNNNNLETGFYYREIGLFAKDPDNDEGEILYCYGNAGTLADYIPAQGSELIEKKINIIAIIGNATNVSAIINSSLVSLSPEDLDNHDKDPEAHKPIRDWVLSLFNNINVSSDVEEVVNRRVNTDISKPLNTLISGWIDTAKTAILNSISTLTSHVTSQHTTTKSHVTSQIATLPQKSVWTDARGAKLDNLDQKISTLPQKSIWTDARAGLLDKLSNLNQSLSGTQTNIINAINAARDNIKSHVTSALAPLIGANKVYVPSTNSKYTISANTYKANTVIGRFQFNRDGVVRIRGGISSSSTYLQYIYMALYNDSNPEYNPPWAYYNAPVGSTISKSSAGGIVVGAPNTVDICVRVQKGAVAVFYSYANGGVSNITLSEFNVYFDEVSV